MILIRCSACPASVSSGTVIESLRLAARSGFTWDDDGRPRCSEHSDVGAAA